MEISPKTFREVEFREKRHGYHPDDVDQFLEQMATGIESMQERMRQALDRAQRAEQAASETGTSDETLRRTLVLAQRTADLAVQESREQAARIVSSAEQQAQSVVADAEERARRLHGEALADVHAELAKLEATRAQAQQEVDALNRWAEEHRAHLTTTLRDAMAMVERAGVLSPAPSSTPIDAPPARRAGGPPPALPPAAQDDPAGRQLRPGDEGPAPQIATAPANGQQGPPPQPSQDNGRPGAERPVDARLPGDNGRQPPEAGRAPQDPRPQDTRVQDTRAQAEARFPTGPGPAAGGGPPTQAIPVADQRPVRPAEDPERDMLTDPDDEALNSYFEDHDLGDDRRFGGRLRRRR